MPKLIHNMHDNLGRVIELPDELYSMTTAVMPGDGIGPEVIKEALKLMKNAGDCRL